MERTPALRPEAQPFLSPAFSTLNSPAGPAVASVPQFSAAANPDRGSQGAHPTVNAQRGAVARRSKESNTRVMYAGGRPASLAPRKSAQSCCPIKLVPTARAIAQALLPAIELVLLCVAAGSSRPHGWALAVVASFLSMVAALVMLSLSRGWCLRSVGGRWWDELSAMRAQNQQRPLPVLLSSKQEPSWGSSATETE